MTENDTILTPLLDEVDQVDFGDEDTTIKSTATPSTSSSSYSSKNIKKKRTKLCEDINRNVVQTERRLFFNRKSFKLRYLWKRKPLFYLLAILIFVFLVNLTLNRDISGRDNDDLYIIRNLHSHVPGMKGK